MADLAAVLGGAVPQSLKEICARLRGLAAAESYQEFDAAARESWAEKEAFAEAHERYDKARRLRDRAFHLSQIIDYLRKACDVDNAIEITAWPC